MTINAAGLDLLKRSEGCRLKAYQDQKGVWTIGYGDTHDVKPGMVITQAEAEKRLSCRVAGFERGVTDLLEVQVTSNQFSALVVFAYNVGINALGESTLLRLLNSGHAAQAADELRKWNHLDGKVSVGLTTRRELERDLFLLG
jgi:lysozyme